MTFALPVFGTGSQEDALGRVHPCKFGVDVESLFEQLPNRAPIVPRYLLDDPCLSVWLLRRSLLLFSLLSLLSLLTLPTLLSQLSFSSVSDTYYPGICPSPALPSGQQGYTETTLF